MGRATFIFGFLTSLISGMEQAKADMVVTFDDLPAPSVIANGYNGLNWNNFSVVNTNTVYSAIGANGYTNGTISWSNVAYNTNVGTASFSSSTPFTFASGYLTAAWNNNMNIEVQGYLNGNLVDQTNLIVNATGPTFSPNWQDVDTIQFTASGGTSAGYDGSGEYFALDNLDIAAVPEPSSFLLLGIFAVFVGYLGWRKRYRPATA